MNCEQIYKIASQLVSRWGTCDPFELCACLGVNVRYADLGLLKGMYKYLKRNYFIVISNKLSMQMRRMVCCHELSHHILHRDVSKNVFLWDSMLFDKSGGIEHEANMLCAELLISDEEMNQLTKDGKTVDEIAALLEVACGFVMLKGKSMQLRGFDIKGNFEVNPDFLSNIKN